MRRLSKETKKLQEIPGPKPKWTPFNPEDITEEDWIEAEKRIKKFLDEE